MTERFWLAWSPRYSVDPNDRMVVHSPEGAQTFREAGWNVEGPFVLEVEHSGKKE